MKGKMGVRKVSTSPAQRTRSLILLLTAVIILAGLSYNSMKNSLSPRLPGSQAQVQVQVSANATTTQVALMLESKGLIKNQQSFLLYARLKGYDGKIKAGTYDLGPAMTVQEIIQILVQGRETQTKITFPEGYTLEQMASLLADRKIVTRAEFWAAAQKDYPYDFLDGIPRGEKYLEGFLYPDTYYLPPGSSAEDIINIMLKRFGKEWHGSLAKLLPQAPYKDPSKLVTIASMIERETIYASERPRVAGVIYNRLKDGMPLQVDATVLYALGTHKETVTYKDLEVKSPYNTYRVKGLPPGPIAAPGLTSLKAAMAPEKHQYYYYVAKGDGHHYFSKTFAEHKRAIAKYRGK
ncbi:MAG: endolytic transglycosylase MltG [Methylocystaceae bacterium]